MLSNIFNMIERFLLVHALVFLICKLKFGLFILFNIFLFIIVEIIYLIISETMDVPSSEMIGRAWRNIHVGEFIFLQKGITTEK
jgi:hypothetical protein